MNVRIKLAAGVALLALVPANLIAAPKSAQKAEKSGSSAATASDPMPSFGPPPDWVVEEPIPAADPDPKMPAAQMLLTESQERLTKAGVQTFVEYVIQPGNQAGLQAVGTVAIPWNVNRASLTINRVDIIRDGKPIDALKRDDLSVIRREKGLEQSTLTGVRTVVLPVRGLRVGDQLRVAITYEVPTKVGSTEEIQDLTFPMPVQKVVRRFLLADDLPVRWWIDPSIKESSKRTLPTGVERVFVANKSEPMKERSFVPDRFKSKLIQVSSFSSWPEVAAPLIPLFDDARKIAPDSHVAELAAKIAHDNPDPAHRMLAALRAVQDDVRYVAVLLGDGDYHPMSADEVWSRRFGDCKGKTALLLALLDRLEIPAEPVLASVQFDDGLETRLPSLAVMDHVYVRARIGEEGYYLDGTKFGQRTLEELKDATTRHGLPLTANASLITFPDVMLSQPLQETTITWDATKSVTDKIPFELALVLRGDKAAQMRLKSASADEHSKVVDELKAKIPDIENDALELVSEQPEAPDGSYVAKFKGSAYFDWRPVDGLKGNRTELSQSTFNWDGKFDRDEGEGKDVPVLMAYPYWERLTEKVILPNHGKDFRLEAGDVDRTIAVTRMTRTIRESDGVILAVSDFKRLKREMGAEEARAAKPELDKLGADYAYIVAKKKMKLPD